LTWNGKGKKKNMKIKQVSNCCKAVIKNDVCSKCGKFIEWPTGKKGLYEASEYIKKSYNLLQEFLGSDLSHMSRRKEGKRYV
jgi:hypothetical protein